MWMELPFDIRGKRYSISLLGILCWIGFAQAQYRSNEASVFGLPKWLAVSLLFLVMILTATGTSRLDGQPADQATESSSEATVIEDE